MATINGTSGNDNLPRLTDPSTAGDDIIYGFAGNDTIRGDTGSDMIYGGAGIDSMLGGDGNDGYSVDSTSDVIIEGANAGTDVVYAYASYTLSANVENLYIYDNAYYGYGNALNNSIVGNASNNYLWGGVGNDVINGGAGIDSMLGGDGNDDYSVDSTSDVIIEGANAGTDTVYAYASYSLSANVENLYVYGTGYYGYGNELNNYIVGNAGSNVINGGAGNDTMAGGAGNDVYYVDSTGDVVSEGVAVDTDHVYAYASYTLGANVENLYMYGSAYYGYGNELNNYILGNAGNNYLWGGAGNDVINGGAGNDTMVGGDGNDAYYVDSASDVVSEGVGAGTDTVYGYVSGYTLGANVENLYLYGSASSGYGNALNNYIAGNAGNNLIWGGAGVDTMTGGAGNDMYYVDSSSDVVIEGATVETDYVYAYASYTLGANVENLYLLGSAYYGYGNALNNYIAGNAGNNVINGGAGNDSMAGGLGNDGYYVDSTSDVIYEGVNAGADSVYAYASYTLGANIENLYMYGTAYYGYGNALNNYIVGSSGHNYLSGGAGNDNINAGVGNDMIIGGDGNDTMVGGDGNDSYFVDSIYDVVSEGVSTDTDSVYTSISYTLGANVETLYLQGSAYYGYGNALNNYIVGNSGNNYLWGSAGNDTINGGLGSDTMLGGDGNDSLLGLAGSDVLTGGAGADYFTFYSTSEGIDTITDFSSGQLDKIALSASGFGSGLTTTTGTTPGSLLSSQFSIGAGATTSNHRVIYNSSTGALFFDQDGTGAAAQVQIATLSTGLALISSDFQVIA